MSAVVHTRTHLKLHDHVIEFVVSPAADKLTDVIFTWKRKRKKAQSEHLKHCKIS